MSEVKVTMDKKYKTVSGRPVTILGVDFPLEGGFSVIGLVYSTSGKATPETWKASGSFLNGSSHDLDLVECKPYEDFKMDEPVMVSSDGVTWFPRHFAGVNSAGYATFWTEGTTSWTAENVSRAPIAVAGFWKVIRKPTSEELKNA